MKKIKKKIYNFIKEVIENEFKTDLVYNYKGSKIRTTVSNVPKVGDFVNLFYCGTYQELQVQKVVFEMHGGVTHIYLEKP